MRDGDFTKIGWVADVVNNKFGNPTKSLDPVGRMKINEKFCDAAGSVSSGSFNQFRWRSNASFVPATGALVTTTADIQGLGYFGSNADVWDSGYNTNFATTWHFSRGDNNITSGNFYTTNGDPNDPDKCPLDGDGPLTTGILGDPTLKTSADKIGLMGAARVGDGADSTINASGVNAANTINSFIDPTGRKKLAKVGDFSVESFCDGPAAAVTGLTDPGVYGDVTRVHEINDIVPNCKAKKVINQSNPDGLLAGGYANILFADGSARRVNDNNGYGGANKGDSWIGPFKSGGLNSTGSFIFDNGAYDEVRDEMYLGRLRSLLTSGGGSAEG
jgi:prepilin-type processing-associated H-X9-DG protein